MGDLRWKAPEDPDPWSGVRDASEYGGIGVQYDGNPVGEQKVIGSEDCLYLNIWRPQSQERDLPVYFWIHGGGNTIGSSRDNEGMSISGRGDMIVVTIQYRLGPFGWFTHPSMRTGEDRLGDSGNYGTLDIIKALEWVRDNISAFGGDPDNVTIAGESAGGLNVFTMIISPLAEGLFHKAMIQSGDFWTTSMSEADEDGGMVLEAMLKADSLEETPDNDVASYLRGKSADEIMNAYVPGAAGLIDQRLGAYLDGIVLPESGIGALSDPAGYNRVPMIIGANRDERKLFNFFFYTEENALAYGEPGHSVRFLPCHGTTGKDSPSVFCLMRIRTGRSSGCQMNRVILNRKTKMDISLEVIS
ncbi:MAG: carboxylesterase family protein [Spirochaetales bacterium]|nr:carboxylesterase family protein [Spirochaetales bacterium]